MTGSTVNNSAIVAMLSLWTLTVILALVIAGISIKAVFILAIATILGIPLLVRIATSRFDVFEPLVLANFALGTMFVIRPLADIATGSYDHLGYDIRSTFDLTLFASLVGCAAFEFGYSASLGRLVAAHLPLPAPNLNVSATKKAAVACFLVGGVLFGTFLHSQGGLTTLLVFLGGRNSAEIGVLQRTTGYLYQGMDLFCPGALLFFAVGLVSHHRIYLILGLLLLSPYLIYYTAQGDRSVLLPVVVALLTFPYLYKGKRPHSGTLALILLAGIIAISVIQQTRVYGNSNSDVTDVSGEMSRIGSVFTGSDDEMFDTFANVVSIIPSRRGFSPGGTLRDFGIRVVPRVLWPQKPHELDAGVAGALWPELPTGFTAEMPSSSVLCTFYEDSGLIGVFAGMFVVGFAASTLWQWYLRCDGSAYSTLIYAMTLPYMLVLLRGYPADTVARMTFTVFPLCLLGYAWMLRQGLFRATIQSLHRSLPNGNT